MADGVGADDRSVTAADSSSATPAPRADAPTTAERFGSGTVLRETTFSSQVADARAALDAVSAVDIGEARAHMEASQVAFVDGRAAPQDAGGSFTRAADAAVPDRETFPSLADIDRRSELHLDQTENELNAGGAFEGTCGLASATEVLNDFGHDQSFNGLIEDALDRGQCDSSGGTSAETIREILTDHGETANVIRCGDVEGLAGDVRNGYGVVAAVNIEALHGLPPTADSDGPNHAVQITGVEAGSDGHPINFYVNDSGIGEAGRCLVVPVDRMRDAYEFADGGTSIVTDRQRTGARL